MKRLEFSIGIWFWFSMLVFAQPGQVNQYGLRVVSDPAEHSALVLENDNLRLENLREILIHGVFDIRYATENNFTGKVVYSTAGAFLCKPAAESLKKVEDDLARQGLGLKILDAYRPYQATIKFWEIVQNADYAADPRTGSRHNRGCAVDVTLYRLADSTELEMPTAFDDFTRKAASDFMDLPSQIIQNRVLLKNALEKYGFSQLSSEWWHFDFGGWKNFPVLDIGFEQLPTQ